MFEQILNSSSPELADARKILYDITCRRLYKYLGQTQSEEPLRKSEVCVCGSCLHHSTPPPHTHTSVPTFVDR